jgi:hypothetical protein
MMPVVLGTANGRARWAKRRGNSRAFTKLGEVEGADVWCEVLGRSAQAKDGGPYYRQRRVVVKGR